MIKSMSAVTIMCLILIIFFMGAMLFESGAVQADSISYMQKVEFDGEVGLKIYRDGSFQITNCHVQVR